MKRTCILLFQLLIYNTVLSQGIFDSLSAITSAEVQWIDEYSSLSKKKTRSKHKLGDLLSAIAGVNSRQNSALDKPVALFANGPADMWVVDNANEYLFRIRDHAGEVPGIFFRQKIVFQSLVGICALPGKGILFTDSRLNKVFLIRNNQKSIEVFSTGADLHQPTGIAYAATRSEIWVVETGAHCITVLDESGNRIRSFGSRGTGKGEFNFPTSLWVDDKGFAYIVDALNYRVQIFDPLGNFIHLFGTAGNASGYFARPKGIATDSYGNIYVADALFHAVQIFDKKGNYLYAFGSQGREQGQFWMPSGIFIDKLDNIYVADSYNSRIQLFKLTAIVKRNETAGN